MRVRYLLPAMGALAITPAFAADGVGYTLSGWSDNILSISKASRPTGGPTDPADWSTGFQSQAVLKVGWNVGSDVSGKISIFTNDVGTATSSPINVRESYVTWAVTKEVAVTMGKSYNPIGWLAPDALGLYSINASLIGYNSLYGADALGASVKFTPASSPLSGSFWVVNGFNEGSNQYPQSFTGAANTQPVGQKNSDLGYMLDVEYALPDKKGKINAELVYDLNGADNGSVTSKAGDLIQLGLNGTFKPYSSDKLTVGAEFIYRVEQESNDNAKDGAKTIALLGLVNYQLPEVALGGKNIPVSGTAMLQYWKASYDATGVEDTTAYEVAAALLTNPTASTNFGWNFELAYTGLDDESSVIAAGSLQNSHAFVASTEMLVSF